MRSFPKFFPATAPLRPAFLGAWLAGWLLLAGPRPARADDGITYKYADYAEGGGRMSVRTQTALLEQGLGTDTQLRLLGVIDAISGASPNGQPAPAGSDQVPLSTMHDRRKAWNLDLVRQISHVSLDLGVANSRESDYTSTGWSVNAQADFNEKNTLLLGGIAGTNDDIRVLYQSPWATKRTNDTLVGLTQLLDPRTSLSCTLTVGRATGYLNDQYKLVQKKVAVAPGVFLPFTYGENRPGSRTRTIFLAVLNHGLQDLPAAVEASYRYYHDTFGTNAHTLEASWLQHVGPALIVSPKVRYYRQSAADFYYYNLDSTTIMPTGIPDPAGPFFSSDYRLSELRTLAYGLKAVWQAGPRVSLDAEWLRYEMRGLDGVTPRSAYPQADIVTVGGRFTW